MNHRTDRPAVLRDSWRPDENHQPLFRKAKKVLLLVLLTTLLLVAFFAFFFLLAEPILHPNAYVILAKGDSAEADSIPPVHFANTDFSRFDALAPYLAKDAIDSLNQPVQLVPNQELNQLQERIQELEAESRDVLILYVCAHGLVINGKASLIVDGFDQSSPGVGSFTIRSLLQLLSESQFKTKVLVLDSGQLPYDAWLGNVANQFQGRLRQTVSGFDQSDIWVLSSNDLAQHSYVSESAGTSIFAHFVRESLAGNGDLDGDGFLRLNEFAEYVSQMVENHSRQQTDAPIQRPVLLGSPGSSSDPILLSVETRSVVEQLPDDEEGMVENNVNEQKGSFELAANQKPVGSNADGEGTGASNAVDKDGQLTNDGEKGVAAKDAGEAAANDSENSNVQNLLTELTTADPFAVQQQAKPSLGFNLEQSSQHLKALEATWAKTYESHSELVRSVWQRYFLLEHARSYPRRPLDYAPVEWRKLGELIAFHDYRIRRQLEADQSADRLREILLALEAIQNETPLPASGKLDTAVKIVDRGAAVKVRVNSSLSIAHLQVLLRRGFCELTPDAQQLITSFEASLRLGSPQKLKELLETRPTLLQWYEPQLAKSVLQLKNLSWDEQRQIVLLSLMGGNSTDPISIAFEDISQKFKQAHERRRVGTQIMLEQTVPNWKGLASSLLVEARRGFVAANHDFHVVQNAYAIRNEIIFRLPYYLRMPFADSESYLSELYHRLDRLLDATAELGQSLNQHDQVEVAASVEAAANLVVKRNREFIGFLVASGKEGTKSTVQKSLFNRQSALLTPGIDLSTRNEILLSMWRETPPIDSSDVLRQTSSESADANENAVPNELLVYQRQFNLVLKYAQLANISDPDAPSFAELKATIDKIFAGDLRVAPSSKTRDRIDQANRLVSALFREIPNRIDQRLVGLQDLSDSSDRRNQLHQLETTMALRLLIDSRDAQLADSVADNSRIVSPARCFSMLAAQRTEMLEELRGETQIRAKSFQKQLEFQRLAANELNGQPKLARPAAQKFEIKSADTISLATQKVKRVEFEFTYRGESAEPVWVFAEFDEKKISVQPATAETIYNRNQFLVSSPGLLDPRRFMSVINEIQKTNQDALPPTMVMRPGESRTLRLDIANTSDASHTQLYLTVISADEIARHQTTVLMPAQSDWELYLDSPFSQTTRSGSEMVVSPLPNQSIDYDFQLRNLSGRPRKISMELLAAQSKVETLPPSGEVDPQQLLAYFDSVGSPSSLLGLGDLDIPPTADLQSIPLRTQPKKPTPDDTPGDDAASATKKPKEPESLLQIRHGMFVVVTDQVSLKSRIWLVRFRPQMPRRYVSAVARYDALQERIIIEVSRPEDAQMPSGGHTVKCEFANPLTSGAESFLEGQLTSKKRTLKLFAHVSKSNNRVEKVFLHVDDYPRSFVFNIPCGNSSEVVPESRNEMRIQINSPEIGTGYAAPVDTIPVKFEVDAPVGAFADSRDVVKLGLDADRDRELSEESTMSWTTDRQATVWVADIGKKRSLRLVNRVEDFQVDLPGANYRNLKVNLLARLQVGRKVVWSNPREISLDAAPPKIVSIKTSPTGAVSQEEKLKVHIVADDEQMSGVKSIKVGFYDAAKEQIDEKLPQVDAKNQPDNSWVAELPLADIPVGNQRAVVVATDQVGNTSELKTFGITVVTKEEKQNMAQTVNVKGSVRYYKSPQPNVPVQLTSTSGKTYSASTGDDGTFRFTDVPVGQYFLKAKSVIRNKPRIGELKLDLKAGQDPQALDVELK